MTRRAAKVDANQSDVVDALRAAGCSVQSLAALGKGVPDLLVARGNSLWLMEVKNKHGRNRITPDQTEWAANWRGRVHVVLNADEAMAVLRVESACA